MKLKEKATFGGQIFTCMSKQAHVGYSWAVWGRTPETGRPTDVLIVSEMVHAQWDIIRMSYGRGVFTRMFLPFLIVKNLGIFVLFCSSVCAALQFSFFLINMH